MELPSAEALSRDRRQEPARGTDNAGLPSRPEPSAPESRAVVERQRWADRLEKIENPVSSRAESRERLNNFEPGHPSSPWDEHGKPRQPVPRLADLERLDPPLTDAAYAAHRETVSDKLKRALEARLTTKDQFAIDKDGEAWVAERRAVHNEIIRETYDAAVNVPCERKAAIAGGLGSKKSWRSAA